MTLARALEEGERISRGLPNHIVWNSGLEFLRPRSGAGVLHLIFPTAYAVGYRLAPASRAALMAVHSVVSAGVLNLFPHTYAAPAPGLFIDWVEAPDFSRGNHSREEIGL